MQENNLDEQTVPFALYAQKAKLTLTGPGELLSTGMEGVIPISFTFSEDWAGLEKTAVFTNGARTVKVSESEWYEGICMLPQTVLETAGKTVLVGVYGTNGLHLVLPTVWCVLGRVEPGADLSGVPESPGSGLNTLVQRIEALEQIPAVTEQTVAAWGFTKNALTQHQSLTSLVPRNQQAAMTTAMTQPVGIDENGKLWTAPGSGTDAKVKTLAVTESSGAYTYYGADFSFSTLDEVMALATEGAQIRLAVINTGDVYLLTHMQGSQSTARLYFSGITWSYTMTSPKVEVFEVCDAAISKVCSVDLADVQNNIYPITVSVNGSTVTVDRTIAQIYAAVSAGKSCPVVVDGNYCGWVGYADQGECALYYINAHDSAPRLDMVYMDGTDVLLSDRELEMSPTEITLSGTTQTIIAWDNAIYKCGELTSLTISSAVGTSIIRFTSGTTPTALTIPQTLHMPDGFSVEANTRYEISVSGSYAVVAGWTVNA